MRDLGKRDYFLSRLQSAHKSIDTVRGFLDALDIAIDMDIEQVNTSEFTQVISSLTSLNEHVNTLISILEKGSGLIPFSNY